MDNTPPQTSGEKASPPHFPGAPTILLFLFAIGIPTTAGLTFAQTITQNPWQWLLIGLLYGLCIGMLGFLGKVVQKLEGSLVDKTALWIEMQAAIFFSHSWRCYRNYLIHEHEVFDIKGLSTLPDRDLELEQVFVQLDIDPTPIHQASYDPIQMPTTLQGKSHHIWSYLQNIRSRHFVITGPPGSGKTTLLKHMALSLAKRRKAGVQRMPVLLYLRDHATTIQGKYDDATDKFEYSLAEAINTHVQRKWQQPLPLPWIQRQLLTGQCLILLDGLDEVADATVRKLVVTWVQRQMLAYGENRFILTSRPHGYADNPLEGVWVLETQPFTPGQIAQFVQNWYLANEYKSWQKKDAGMLMRAREGAHDLLGRLYRIPALLAFAVNPLLLTMIATVHRYRGSLPGSRVALYSEICEVFLGKRRKVRGLATELSPAQMLQILRPLAYAFMRQGNREMKREEACQIIAPHLLRVSTCIQPDEFLLMVQNNSGLLLERNPGLYGFAHKTFQEYLTAAYIKEERLERELVVQVQDDWWHETIRLYCAQADATAIVRACLANDPPSAKALALALDCVEEKLTIEPVVKEQLDALLEKGREDPKPERRRVIAEALLRRRLDQMIHLHDEVFVDTSFVTCAEYQLFLDEQRARGQDCRPDHWLTPTFPQGQGHLALMGMRPADVKAFCQWLTERDAGVWHYRMPTMSEHQQIEEKLQGTCKLDAGSGYWVNDGQDFVWVGGKIPSTESSSQNFYQFDLDHSIHLACSLNLDLVSDINVDRALALARASAHDLDLALDYALDYALDLDLARVYNYALDLDRALALARASAHDLDLDLDLALDFAHDRAHDHDLDRALASVLTRYRFIPVDVMLPLVKALIYNRALYRICSLLNSLRSSIRHKNINETDEQNLQSIYSALNLYADLQVLDERRKGQLSPWEGILLVKERKQSL